MTSWIYNSVIVKGEVHFLLQIFESSSEGIFAALVPLDDQSSAARITCWGTKTEIYPEGADHEDTIVVDVVSENEIHFSFVTEDAPPIGVFLTLMQLGLRVRCDYQTLRACYGTWDQGKDERILRSLL